MKIINRLIFKYISLMKNVITFLFFTVLSFSIVSAQKTKQVSSMPQAKGELTTEQEQAKKRVLVPKGTIVTLAINQVKVSSSDLEVNSIVCLEVAEPVYVDGEEVITKGSYAEGKILKIKKHGGFGKAGEVVIVATNLTAFDNQRIHINGEPLPKKGKSRRGLAVCVTICCPIFPFVGSTIKGYPAELERGTRLNAVIAYDVYAHSNPTNSGIFEQ